METTVNAVAHSYFRPHPDARTNHVATPPVPKWKIAAQVPAHIPADVVLSSSSGQLKPGLTRATAASHQLHGTGGHRANTRAPGYSRKSVLP